MNLYYGINNAYDQHDNSNTPKYFDRIFYRHERYTFIALEHAT